MYTPEDVRELVDRFPTEVSSDWAPRIREYLDVDEPSLAADLLVASVVRERRLPDSSPFVDGVIAAGRRFDPDSRWLRLLEGRARYVHGASNFPDPWGRTPLHYEALADNATETRKLLRDGMNPDIADVDGMTALHLAADVGAIEVAEALLEAKSAIDAEDENGWTPLHGAVLRERGDGKIVRLLLKHGANPDHQAHTGQTVRGLAHLIGARLPDE
jgi:hypothetical protein